MPGQSLAETMVGDPRMKKDGQHNYGYASHIDVDVKHKLICSCEVASASVHLLLNWVNGGKNTTQRYGGDCER